MLIDTVVSCYIGDSYRFTTFKEVAVLFVICGRARVRVIGVNLSSDKIIGHSFLSIFLLFEHFLALSCSIFT